MLDRATVQSLEAFAIVSEPVVPAGTAVSWAGMQTRTLLLLSLVCGLAILVAGMVVVLQIADQGSVPDPEPLGQPVAVGDMTVVVEGSTASEGRRLVDIRIGGVDDPSGSDTFVLRSASTDTALIEGCGPIRAEIESCTLQFAEPDDPNTTLQLLYGRGDQRARWVLRSVTAG